MSLGMEEGEKEGRVQPSPSLGLGSGDSHPKDQMGKEVAGRTWQSGVCPSLSNKSGNILGVFFLCFLEQGSHGQNYHTVKTQSDKTMKESQRKQ